MFLLCYHVITPRFFFLEPLGIASWLFSLAQPSSSSSSSYIMCIFSHRHYRRRRHQPHHHYARRSGHIKSSFSCIIIYRLEDTTQSKNFYIGSWLDFLYFIFLPHFILIPSFIQFLHPTYFLNLLNPVNLHYHSPLLILACTDRCLLFIFISWNRLSVVFAILL